MGPSFTNRLLNPAITQLVCPIWNADMRIVAFVTGGDTVRHILDYIVESMDPRDSR